jgi:hypothetical protein
MWGREIASTERPGPDNLLLEMLAEGKKRWNGSLVTIDLWRKFFYESFFKDQSVLNNCSSFLGNRNNGQSNNFTGDHEGTAAQGLQPAIRVLRHTFTFNGRTP